MNYKKANFHAINNAQYSPRLINCLFSQTEYREKKMLSLKLIDDERRRTIFPPDSSRPKYQAESLK